MENHVHIDGTPVSGAIFDFAIYFFHNAKALLARNSGPYFYLPKLEMRAIPGSRKASTRGPGARPMTLP